MNEINNELANIEELEDKNWFDEDKVFTPIILTNYIHTLSQKEQSEQSKKTLAKRLKSDQSSMSQNNQVIAGLITLTMLKEDDLQNLDSKSKFKSKASSLLCLAATILIVIIHAFFIYKITDKV